MALSISIAMTTFNGARFLAEQLESLRAQSRPPDELVVCDDRSTDSTQSILSAFARSAPFDVRICCNDANIGHERNFAKAIDYCGGDLIFLSDQDDVWYPEKLAAAEQVFLNNRTAFLVVNDVLITDEQLVPTGRTVLGQMRAAGVLGRNCKSLTLGCATAFRSSLRPLLSPVPPLDYGHDSWIHDFADILGARHVLRRVLQFYRRHGENASNWAFNGEERASPLVVMRPSAGRNLTSEYAKRRRALSTMRERVCALGPEAFAGLGLPRSYEEVLETLERAIRAVDRRSQIFERDWLGRKLLALQLLCGGDYRHFLGWRSLGKDLIR
jgi:glycosyltransferase involved in cell wall biosynthesis